MDPRVLYEWRKVRQTVRDSKKETREQAMIIGAAIAGLLIVSLFLEMVSSSPKANEEHSRDLEHVK
jgi:hypothetical protein